MSLIPSIRCGKREPSNETIIYVTIMLRTLEVVGADYMEANFISVNANHGATHTSQMITKPMLQEN